MDYKQIISGVFGVIILCSAALGTEQQSAGVGLTIYNDNFAVVKERRQMDFAQGQNTVKFTDVATAIDSTSVSFECLSSPGAVTILEQNYQYDLANSDSLLKRYLEKPVQLTVKGSGSGPVRDVMGTLVSSQNQSVILAMPDGGLTVVGKDSIEAISLKEMPKDLLIRPTLVWLADAKKAGSELCQISYMTEQVNWKADYKAILDANATHLDLTGWVTIDNKSGIGYRDAALKLVAGDVRRVREAVPQYRADRMMMKMAASEATGFEEKAFQEYHLYTLGRKSTINNNEVKQIELIDPAQNVPAEKLLVYERQQKPDKVQIKVEFKNTKENHLGIALPKGKVRVFSRDPADGGLEFIGEDEIDHTARNEKLSLYIGDAFDVVPEYTLLDSKVGNRMRRDVHKIELRNRKNTPVTVRVDEKFSNWVNWQIEDASQKWEKHDATTARFTVQIPADSNVVLQYDSIQTWY